MELGQRWVDHSAVEDFLECVFLLELCVWVSLRVFVRDPCDFGEVFCFGAISGMWLASTFSVAKIYLLVHILLPSISKILRIPWRIVLSILSLHHGRAQTHGTWSITPNTLDTAWTHLLKSNHHHAIDSAIPDQRPRHMQTRRACSASIVGVIDWDRAHAELVEDALTRGRVAVAIACYASLDVVVGYACVEHGLDASFIAKFGILSGAARL